MFYYLGDDHYVKVLSLKKHRLARKFRNAAQALGKRWKLTDSNARSTPGGGMISLGTKKAAGFQEHMIKGPNRRDIDAEFRWLGINRICAKLNILASKIAKKPFWRAYTSIKTTAHVTDITIAEYMGGESGLSPQIVQSGHGFKAESHFDFDVSPYCLSIWNSDDGTDPEGWYFLLPAVEGTYDGVPYQAVAIRLRDSTAIEWSGRMLRHCSTAPIDSLINVFGTFFGIIAV